MTYNGLTIADKPALEDAQSVGMEWAARAPSGALFGFENEPLKVCEYRDRYWSGNGKEIGYRLCDLDLQFIKWSDRDPVHIPTALAQIAEMEIKQKELLSEKAIEKGCLTWSERINQMTVEEKAIFLTTNVQIDCEGFCKAHKTGCDNECKCHMAEFLNSPYTEGETT